MVARDRRAFESAIKLEPDFEWIYPDLAASYGHLGELQKARDALKKFENIRSDYGREPLTIVQIIDWDDYAELTHLDRFLHGLRKAGVPER